MILRERFDNDLHQLKEAIQQMAHQVDEELQLALKALVTLDDALARQVFELDKAVNKTRFEIDQQTVKLIGTQQPVAHDLRVLVSVLSIVVDLERMGDHAKGVAKVIAHIDTVEALPMTDLEEMGELVRQMLQQCMRAYTEGDANIGRTIAKQDDQVDKLFAQVFTAMIERLSEFEQPKNIEAAYEILRVAQELERFGDLTTNIAERIVYIVTGDLEEVNVDSFG